MSSAYPANHSHLVNLTVPSQARDDLTSKLHISVITITKRRHKFATLSTSGFVDRLILLGSFSNRGRLVMGHHGKIGDAKLILLGGACAAELGGRLIKLPRLALVLAAYLLLDCPERRATRRSAARFLWEDLDRSRQAGNLRQLLLRLRALEAADVSRLFEIRAHEIILRFDDKAIDLCVFRSSIPANSESTIAAICKAYSGDLLARLNEGDGRLAAWVASKRTALRAEFSGAVLPYLEGLGTMPTSDIAILAARRIVEMEPLRELGYCVLMRACAERGDRAGLRKLYHRAERRFAAETGCKPSPSMRALYDKLSVGDARTARLVSRRIAQEMRDGRSPGGPSLVDTSVLPRLAVLAHPSSHASSTERAMIDGLAYDLATDIARTGAFTVSAPHPALDGTSPTASFGADYLVEIRARQGAPAPAVALRLLALSSREILWAATHDSPDGASNDVEIAVLSIINRIESREIRHIDDEAEATSAYRLALQGQQLLRGVDLPSIRRARKAFKTALAISPTHVPALAGLSRSHVMEWLVRAPLERSALEVAEQYAKKAISLCPDDYRGHHQLGLVKLYLKQLDESIECLARAKKLNPFDLDVQVDFADALVCDGRASEAVRFYAESEQLRHSSADYSHWILAGAYFSSGDCRAALGEVGRMENPAPAARISAASHAILGERDEAQRIVAASMEFNPGFNLNSWLSMFPCRSHEYVQRYADGLRQAGFK